jgi:thiol-disulfide isomerase/thioredoxin
MAVKKYTRKGLVGPAVLFVKADWCPHCTAMKPEIKKAASIMGSVVPVYEVDSEVHKADIEGMNIKGYPTVFYVDGAGKRKEFNETDRSGKRIADWACAHSGKCGASGRR